MMRLFRLTGCSCRSRPPIFKVEYRSRFERRLKEVDIRADWLRLFRCPACGQHWQIDLEDKYAAQYAIRVDDASGWQTFDDKPVRLQFLVESRGGLSGEECVKAGCTNRALKSLAYCPAHAYESGIRE